MEYLREILIPYVERTRVRLGLPEDQQAMLILDVFAAHREAKFKDACTDAHITTVYVPASCTTFLQPLDADGGVNHALKNHLAEQANNFRRQQRRDALDSNGNIRLDWKPETKISMLKPVHAEWIHKSFEKVKKDKDLIRKGWEKCGIMDVIKDLVQ